MRDARDPGGIAVRVLGVLAFYLGSRSLDRRAATFAFWIDEQGGQARHSADERRRRCGSLAGIASSVRRASRSWSAARRFRWRPWLLLLVWPWIAAILGALLDGKPANLTGMIGGSLELAVPITLGALRRHPVRAQRHAQHRARGQVAGRRVRRVGRRERHGLVTGNALLAVVVGISSAMLFRVGSGSSSRGSGIRHKVDQIIAGIVINIGASGSRTSCSCGSSVGTPS